MTCSYCSTVSKEERCPSCGAPRLVEDAPEPEPSARHVWTFNASYVDGSTGIVMYHSRQFALAEPE